MGKRTLVPLTPRRPVDTASRKLAESLLTQAGFGAVVDIRPLGTHSNAHYAVAASDGRRHILRRFKENAPPHTALVRLDRECWVYRQLTLAGAPVPRLLATSREPGAEAMLTSLVEGEHLGNVVSKLAPHEGGRRMVVVRPSPRCRSRARRESCSGRRLRKRSA